MEQPSFDLQIDLTAARRTITTAAGRTYSCELRDDFEPNVGHWHAHQKAANDWPCLQALRERSAHLWINEHGSLDGWSHRPHMKHRPKGLKVAGKQRTAPKARKVGKQLKLSLPAPKKKKPKKTTKEKKRRAIPKDEYLVYKGAVLGETLDIYYGKTGDPLEKRVDNHIDKESELGIRLLDNQLCLIEVLYSYPEEYQALDKEAELVDLGNEYGRLMNIKLNKWAGLSAPHFGDIEDRKDEIRKHPVLHLKHYEIKKKIYKEWRQEKWNQQTPATWVHGGSHDYEFPNSAHYAWDRKYRPGGPCDKSRSELNWHNQQEREGRPIPDWKPFEPPVCSENRPTGPDASHRSYDQQHRDRVCGEAKMAYNWYRQEEREQRAIPDYLDRDATQAKPVSRKIAAERADANRTDCCGAPLREEDYEPAKKYYGRHRQETQGAPLEACQQALACQRLWNKEYYKDRPHKILPASKQVMSEQADADRMDCCGAPLGEPEPTGKYAARHLNGTQGATSPPCLPALDCRRLIGKQERRQRRRREQEALRADPNRADCCGAPLGEPEPIRTYKRRHSNRRAEIGLEPCEAALRCYEAYKEANPSAKPKKPGRYDALIAERADTQRTDCCGAPLVDLEPSNAYYTRHFNQTLGTPREACEPALLCQSYLRTGKNPLVRKAEKEKAKRLKEQRLKEQRRNRKPRKRANWVCGPAGTSEKPNAGHYRYDNANRREGEWGGACPKAKEELRWHQAEQDAGHPLPDWKPTPTPSLVIQREKEDAARMSCCGAPKGEPEATTKYYYRHNVKSEVCEPAMLCKKKYSAYIIADKKKRDGRVTQSDIKRMEMSSPDRAPCCGAPLDRTETTGKYYARHRMAESAPCELSLQCHREFKKTIYVYAGLTKTQQQVAAQLAETNRAVCCGAPLDIAEPSLAFYHRHRNQTLDAPNTPCEPAMECRRLHGRLIRKRSANLTGR